jgi:hypothetical protein
MDEVLPDVYHWTARHEKIGFDVSPYFLASERVLLDPMVPDRGLAWFKGHGPPADILLSNRHHYRHSARFVEAFGCTVHCHRAGMHEFTHGEVVKPFGFGDTLPGEMGSCRLHGGLVGVDLRRVEEVDGLGDHVHALAPLTGLARPLVLRDPAAHANQATLRQMAGGDLRQAIPGGDVDEVDLLGAVGAPGAADRDA